MKISFMLKREDFYKINENTLGKYYQNAKSKKRLYIYPELNAIVTARPSKAVRDYLYTEFRVNGSPLKRLLVRVYAGALLNSSGLLASKSLKIRTAAHADTLIYPCNKKYRVFDFRKNQVSVFGKDGFPTDDLQREIAFRTRHTADFIPGLLTHDACGYTEVIIDGCPVARSGARMKGLCDRAFSVWSDYVRRFTRSVPGAEYGQMLLRRIRELEDHAVKLGKQVDHALLYAVVDDCLNVMCGDPAQIPISLSHGDLQPGNIWVENGTDKLYIIDWESWQERSVWYDRAVLYENLRTKDGITRYVKNRDLIHATVLLEDVLFRLTELTSLPLDYGCREFDDYITALRRGNTDV